LALAHELSAILQAHFQQHQAIQPQDVYKLLLQRVFGPEHLIDNLRAVQERLYLEVLHLPDVATMLPVVEPLSPGLCRVNLQPFIRQGGSVSGLWKALRQTVRDYQPGTRDDLLRAWSLFRRTPCAGNFTDEQLEQFWQQMATAGFPAVHHSRAYAAANAPHYRVVLCTLAVANP
jgi:hypothetical protein